MPDASIEIFSTCPPSSGADRTTYVQRVVAAARWSEQAGCRGILVYADNSQVDPWLVSQLILRHTESLCPLVAVQPVYTHPYTVAKMVTSLAYLDRRRIYLNMVAGGFTNDLAALNDPTPHDRRYDRLVEYTTIVQRLLAGLGPVSHAGEFYTVTNLKLSPRLDADLMPGIFVSGSSEAGMAAARALGATAIEYPKSAAEYLAASVHRGAGIRVGIISRDHDDSAWAIARGRFPEDRKGQLAHQLAMKVSDSVWHKQLSGPDDPGARSPYWLVPFKNYKTMCPYLVGSHARVGAELGAYLAAGYRTFILDVPASLEDLQHTTLAFRRAVEMSRCQSYSTSG
ncbi:MAG: LLM class flavin-dependent oxidoreductase [Candidatus Rokubacteria bacterium]|nr:LLM class flavin-dependent oxidoreductase [Candidatus Rokubacteria bacterium]